MMNLSNILKVQASLKKYKTIKTDKTTSRILDGSYTSIYKGRSLNFDELREYVVGDEIRDVDWKASSRCHKLLVRQYIAEKKHNIMLVMDTNKRMLGETASGIEKREAALISGGALAYLVNQNGDYVSATFTSEGIVKHFPFKTGLLNLETILATYNNAVTMNNQSMLQKSLDFILNNIRRKMIIILVTDTLGLKNVDEALLRRMVLMHDILVINVSDAESEGKNVYNIGGENYLPAFISKSKALARREKENKLRAEIECADKLKKYGIASITVDNIEDMDNQLIKLLEMHKLSV